MLLWNVLAIVAASASGLIAAVLGREKSKPTECTGHRRLFWLLISVSVLGLGASIALAVVENGEAGSAAATNQALLGQVTDLNVKLAPFLEAASALFPDAGTEEALQRLRQEIDTLEQRTGTLESRTHFRPVDPDIRAVVVERLRAALSELGARELGISVVCEGGSNLRLQVGVEVVEILKEAGYAARGPSTEMTFRTAPTSAVVIGCTQSCIGLANAVYGALRPLLKTPFAGKLQETEQEGCQLVLEVLGDPLFGTDGTVEFQ